jgi:PD-(D/E)XK nuclease superfamily
MEIKMTETKVRASTLPGWPDCPRRGAAKLFKEEIIAAGYTLNETPRGIGATIGTAVHAGAALTLKEKMAHGALAPISTVTDCAIESYREGAAEGILFDRETPASNVAEKQVVGMVSAYQRVIAPQIEPIVVEERLEADTGFGLILSGQNDALAREPGRLRDLKTGKKRGNYKPQLGAYSLLMKSHGLNVESACEDYLPRVGATKPQPDPVTYPHDIAAAETAAVSVLRHIAADIKVFREGDPERGVLPGDAWAFQANPSSILCSAKFCPAHGSTFCTEHMNKESNND